MLSTAIKRHFSSHNANLNKTVCIMANSKQADLVGQRIMANLKQVSGVEDFNFFGYGGQAMTREGMAGQIDVNMDDFNGKDFVTFRKTKNYSETQYSTKYKFVNFVNKHFVRRSGDILDQFDQIELAKRIYHARPSVILSLENEYITFKLYDELRGYYQHGANELPKRHFYNKFIKDYRQWAGRYIDFVHYTIPILPPSSDGFRFPGEYAGQYGAYDAIRHLYSQNRDLKKLLKEESLMVNRNYFAADLEKAISGVKQEFRAKHNIPQDGTVVFFAPGNEIKEAEFCLDSVRRGIREFFLKYSSPTSLSPKAPGLEHYTTVISVQNGSEAEAYIRSFISESEFLGRVVIVTNEENEHFSAMAAADMGIVYDGQLIASAAACHLPTMVLINMRMHHQWFSDLYNRWWTPINIIGETALYPELIGGEAWFGKIADTLGEWYIKPETRYDMIRKMEYFLKDALSYKSLDRTVVRSRDLVLADGNAYDEFKDPIRQIAHHLWADIQDYELRGSSHLPNVGTLNAEIPKLF